MALLLCNFCLPSLGLQIGPLHLHRGDRAPLSPSPPGTFRPVSARGARLPFRLQRPPAAIVFSAQAGSVSDQQSVSIVAAPVVFGSIQASRSASKVQVQVAAFDNTRTAGHLSFRFYDNGGNAVLRGAIAADATAAFAQYFAGSSLGGNFLLHAAFPVTGNTADIVYFEAVFTNSAGSSTTARTALQ